MRPSAANSVVVRGVDATAAVCGLPPSSDTAAARGTRRRRGLGHARRLDLRGKRTGEQLQCVGNREHVKLGGVDDDARQHLVAGADVEGDEHG
jgi:hypothetical protein